MRTAAAEGLGYSRTAEPAVITALVKTLDDPELAPRFAAATALGLLGTEASNAIPALIRRGKQAGGATERENIIHWIEQIEPGAAAELRK